MRPDLACHLLLILAKLVNHYDLQLFFLETEN